MPEEVLAGRTRTPAPAFRGIGRCGRLDRIVVRWNRAAVPPDHVNPI
jgi:hypothetical protein